MRTKRRIFEWGRQLDHFQQSTGSLRNLSKEGNALLRDFAFATIRTHTPCKQNEARNCDETGLPQALSLAKHVFLSIKELRPTAC